MSFIRFVDFGVAARPEARLRVNRTVFISNHFLRKLNALDASFAEIYFDEENKKIGFKFTEFKDVDDTSRKILKEATGFVIDIKAVLKVFKLKDCKRAFISITNPVASFNIFLEVSSTSLNSVNLKPIFLFSSSK